MFSVISGAFAQYRLYFYIAAVVALFGSGAYTGYKLTSDHYQAKQAVELSAAIEQANAQAKIDMENAVKANQIIDDIRLKGVQARSKARIALDKHPEIRDTKIPQDVIDAWNEANGVSTVEKKSDVEATTDARVKAVIERIKGESR